MNRAPDPWLHSRSVYIATNRGFEKVLKCVALLIQTMTLNVKLISKRLIMDCNTSLSPLNKIPFSENMTQELDPRILVRSYLMYRIGNVCSAYHNKYHGPLRNLVEIHQETIACIFISGNHEDNRFCYRCRCKQIFLPFWGSCWNSWKYFFLPGKPTYYDYFNSTR